MSNDRDRGPLWRFVPRVAHVPSVRQQVGAGPDRGPPREPGPNDLRPLREGGEWRPTIILRRFGPARKESEYLPRLLIATAILGGVHRLRELAERLIGVGSAALPRIRRMLDDETLARRKGALKEIVDRATAALEDLPSTRARASNDLEEYRPDGLREIDLEMLVQHLGALIVAAEVAMKRNLTGIDFAVHTATTSPDQAYVKSWTERLLVGAVPGILLLTPESYGRVVLVYDDGRLAYDPNAPSSEDEG